MFRDIGISWNMADSGFGGGSDFNDVGDFGNFDTFFDNVVDSSGTGSALDVTGPVAPTGGGVAIDNGINPDTGAARMDFTGMAPDIPDAALPGSLDFGPGAVTMPSGGVYDILNTPTVGDTTPIDNNWTPLPVGGEILTPDQYTGAADNLVVNTGPSIDTGPDTTGFGDYVSPVVDTTPTATTPVDNGPVTPSDIPYDPYADEGPSQPNPDVVATGPDTTVPDLGEVVITDDRPVAPPIEDVPDLGEVTITDTRPDAVRPVIPDGPEIDLPPYNPPIIDAPPIDITLPPVEPEPEIPTIEIVDDRPVKPEPEPEIPTIEIVAPRPPPPPVIEPPPYDPPIIVPPDILEPLPPIVDPEPPYVPPVVDPEPPYVPPVIDPYVPPYVPPIVDPQPPVVPPVVPPTPPVTPTPDTSGMLNPGWIPMAATTPFYQTTSPNQSQFYWGSHPFMRNMSDLENYNNIPNAPQQPWGAATSAVGGTQYLDINSFLNNMYGTRLPAQPSPTYAPATRYQYPTATRPWTGINPNGMGQLPVLGSGRSPSGTLPTVGTTNPVAVVAGTRTVDPNAILDYWNNPVPTTPVAKP